MSHICFRSKVEEAWSENPLMESQESKKYYYGLWQVLINTSWVGYEHDEWFYITEVSYYIDDTLYTFVRSTASGP